MALLSLQTSSKTCESSALNRFLTSLKPEISPEGKWRCQNPEPFPSCQRPDLYIFPGCFAFCILFVVVVVVDVLWFVCK